MRVMGENGGSVVSYTALMWALFEVVDVLGNTTDLLYDTLVSLFSSLFSSTQVSQIFSWFLFFVCVGLFVVFARSQSLRFDPVV